jgi:hypothetical protein
MPLLMPEMLDEAKLKDVQLAMRKDLRIAAKLLRGKNAWFVAAADVPLPDKTKVSIFLALKNEAEAKAWQLKLKGKKPRVLSVGTCALQTKDGKNVDVALNQVKGDRKAALKTVAFAFKQDLAVKVSDAQAKEDDAGSKQSEANAKAEAREAEKAARTSAAVLSNFGLTPADAAKELGVSPEDVNEVLSQNAARLKAAVDRELKRLRQEASQ